MRSLLSKKGFFKEVIDLVIILPKSVNAYDIFARNEFSEKEVKLMNIWRNGKFVLDKPLFPKRLENLAGKTLKITSFDAFDPFSKEGGYEVSLKIHT